MENLLLEIRTEEIPAGYIEPALTALLSNLLEKLRDARIDHGGAGILGTPRRLAVEVRKVSTKQKPLTAEIVGPPKTVGFDDKGHPTIAAEKFAEKVGIPVNKLGIKETKKGLYLFARKTGKGLPTKTLLKSILPDVIVSIPFPKTMRWADLEIAFARPIRSILALFGSAVVSFQIENIKSGRHTFGHRFMCSGKIKIPDSGDYIEAMRTAYVIVDINERKTMVESEISETAARLGGTVLPDRELVDIVKNLIEYPAVVAGKFDKKFLGLPREILITAMREHQKYFAVIDKHNNLMPWFIAVNNTPAKNMPLVAKGHERVLRARLEDAQFFYKSDLNTPVDAWMDKLHGVLFQARLGSMHEKVVRIETLSAYLTDALAFGSDLKKYTLRAARLCKTDLVTQVVGEFPKLQGVMGKIYAAATGESDGVASAIEEHYRPIYSGGPLPETLAGAVLGIADKIDSICGCFSIGLLPTGASDPYALRRQGIGIVQIILDKGFSFSLRRLIEQSADLFKEKSAQKIDDVVENVYGFLRNRIAQLLADEGFQKDLISAVVSVSADNVPSVWNRVRALATLKTEPDFEPLAVAFKRVANIIKQARQTGTENVTGEVDERLFQDDCESALLGAYRNVQQKVKENLQDGHFDQALLDIASLRNFVDTFFDGVMVLTEDDLLRKNRLALLDRIARLFETFADFSKIST